jgi:hypothetical protein
MAIGPITFGAATHGYYVELTVAVTGATNITITRFDSSGRPVTVRGANNSPITGGLWHGFDWEAPQGRPILYRVTVTDGVAVATKDATAQPVDYGGDWLMPVGRHELGMNVYVEYDGVGGLERPVIRDVIQIVNRPSPIVVSWGRQMWNGTITFVTLEDGERNRFVSLIQYPILMFAPRVGYGFDEPVFASVGSVTEERTTGLGYEPSRRWNVDLQQIQRPPAHYVEPPPAFTWQTRKDEADQWGAVIADGHTWFGYAGYE